MTFTSIDFAFFFPITFFIYWLIKSTHVKAQNFFLLIASYFFYGWWNWRFLLLFIFTSFFSYLIGVYIGKAKSEPHKKLLLFLGVSLSLSLLIFFKYYNFFLESFAQAFSLFGKHINVHTLSLILPLGISFYTFKILGYLLDVYRRKIEPTENIVNYLLFCSYFPQVVAGPIDRASNIIPQLEKERTFNYTQAVDGIKLILWGLFKKVVVADTCAIYVSDIYNNYNYYPGSVLLLGVFYFAFQVYADFSGYSDIAVGIGKTMGFELMINFNHPFISKNITEFWRRWHISLSTWFNDYIFTPVYSALRNWGNAGLFFGIFLTFFLSGLWHGASWHYVFFGVIHGLAIIFETYTKKKRKKVAAKMGSSLYNNISMLLTFCFVLITWVFFRANSMSHAIKYLQIMFSASVFEIPGKLAYIPLVAIMIVWEWKQRSKKHALDLNTLALPVRWALYLGLVFLILYYFGEEQEFYYFKF